MKYTYEEQDALRFYLDRESEAGRLEIDDEVLLDLSIDPIKWDIETVVRIIDTYCYTNGSDSTKISSDVLNNFHYITNQHGHYLRCEAHNTIGCNLRYSGIGRSGWCS